MNIDELVRQLELVHPSMRRTIREISLGEVNIDSILEALRAEIANKLERDIESSC